MYRLLEKINARWWQTAFWILWLVATVLMVLPAEELPEVDIWDKAKHSGAFFALMALAWLGYRQQFAALTLAGLLIGYGVGIECIQYFIPSRSFSVLDMVADAIGVFPVLCAAMWLKKNVKRQIFFVAGTDTGVGKTHVACHLLMEARQRGLKTLGLKPLAAGAEKTSHGLRNEDALLLQQASTVQFAYEDINPFCFAEPVAPHIAASENNVALSAAGIAAKIQMLLDKSDAELVIIEGAGGWRVPLNETETMADVVKLLGIPVILVVGMKLGCINHAILTAEAIRSDGINLHGWIANNPGNPMPCLEENISALAHFLNPASLLIRKSRG